MAKKLLIFLSFCCFMLYAEYIVNEFPVETQKFRFVTSPKTVAGTCTESNGKIFVNISQNLRSGTQPSNILLWIPRKNGFLPKVEYRILFTVRSSISVPISVSVTTDRAPVETLASKNIQLEKYVAQRIELRFSVDEKWRNSLLRIPVIGLGRAPSEARFQIFNFYFLEILP